MKYIYTVIDTPVFTAKTITTTEDEDIFTNFPAEVGNPNYDAFLTQVDLSNEEVHALTPDVWYDFPEADPA